MTNTNQLLLILVLVALLCGFSYGYSEVLAPINDLAKALGSARP